ncbi:MAG: Arc family DNA-binding protein [Actinobacteria bacterium]|nr:Arc family DNA-binding protein [Actinomycetota bacterium]
MPTLYLRDVPEHVIQELRRRASASRRSLNAEAIVCLEQALERSGTAEPLVLEDIVSRLDEFAERTRDKWGSEDSADIIREGREERGDW